MIKLKNKLKSQEEIKMEVLKNCPDKFEYIIYSTKFQLKQVL